MCDVIAILGKSRCMAVVAVEGFVRVCFLHKNDFPQQFRHYIYKILLIMFYDNNKQYTYVLL